MNYPSIRDEVELIRRLKAQEDWTNAQLATSMTAEGWTIGENLVNDWLDGRSKPSEYHREYIRLYLLNHYYGVTLA